MKLFQNVIEYMKKYWKGLIFRVDLLGKNVADKLTEDIKVEVDNLRNKGVKPTLAILRVGERPDDLAYERGALARCEKCGIDTTVVTLDEGVDESEYIKALEMLNKDKNINGILCFRPLPSGIDENRIKYIIDPKKDVDAFSPINIAKLMAGEEDRFSPCTPQAVLEIMDYYNIDLCGKNVVVIGRSMVVGKPISMLLTNKNATVTICHSKTENLAKIASCADILISCVGRAKMIGKDFVKKGQYVIDVGINVDKHGKLCGDVDYSEVVDIVKAITPVPRGVGSVTSSVLAKQVVESCKIQNKLD